MNETERRRRAEDPSLILERDLADPYLIDDVFIGRVGTGARSMVLAGIEVRKQVIPYKSNSGKSTGWRVRFDWVGSDRKSRSSEKVPPEAANRRNDSERNWGLPE